MSYSKTYVGNRTTDFDYAPKSAVYTGVNLTLDDGTEVFVGTDTNVLNATLSVCNSTVEATAYANWLLSALSGYRYQPYSADGVLLDPAMQLGDGVDIRTTYGGIYRRTTTFGRLMKSDITAPYTEEVNHEYPYVDEYERKQDRKYTRLEEHMESEFTVQASQISAKVSKLSPDGQTSFSWALNDTEHTWYANGTQVMKVSSAGLEVNGSGTFSGTITANAGVIGGCTIENGTLKVGSANVTSLSIGSNFSVDSSGNMIANNGTFTGTLAVGGNYIAATDLYTGAYQSATTYGSWNNGTYYAYSGTGSYYNSIQSGTSSYPSYFKCGYITVVGYINMSGAAYVPKTATIDGVTIKYLGTS